MGLHNPFDLSLAVNRTGPGPAASAWACVAILGPETRVSASSPQAG
jgi:hypothetical protein